MFMNHCLLNQILKPIIQCIVDLKFYLFDCGIYRSMRKTGLLDNDFEINGGVLEGLVFQHLRAYCDYSDDKNKIFYWRTKAGVEVDFIVYGEKESLDKLQVEKMAGLLIKVLGGIE